MELPNLSLSSAQALSVPVQLQENVLLTDTAALARLKQISTEGGDGAGGTAKVAMAQKTSTWVFSGAEIWGGLQEFSQEEEREGPKNEGNTETP